MFINHNGTLTIHNKCYQKKWYCHENVGVGLPLIDNIGEMLAELFGCKTIKDIRGVVMEGKECYFETTQRFDLHREVEKICIKYDLPIIPRTQMDVGTLVALKKQVKGTPVSKHYREV